MSSESPASVLFDILGNTLAVYNNTAGVAGQPLLPIAGYDGYANVTRYLLTNGQGSLMSTPASTNISVLSNATVTTAGSDIYTIPIGTQQINLIVNSTVTATGTTPSLTFTIQEVDPGNATTTFGNSASTTALTNANTPGVFTAVLTNTHSSAIKVSWAISGTTPSFTGVYVTVTTKATPDTQAISGTVSATNPSVGTDGSAALTSDTQVGGKVTTAAPAYTTGNLNALSLTTLGGLRIDGVYAAATANATAADVANVGGYVTTAAPTYTTGQLNPLSLDISGNLRTSVNNTVTVTGAAASTFNNQSVGTDAAAALGFDTQVGGKVTTAAPTYTTGNLDALSLTTLGGLRIDGVYASGTATSTAADVMGSAGWVTTAAPTYTTGNLNALSLTTAGQLRIDSAYPTGTATGSAPDMNQTGGIVTTAAPTYTTGQVNALSLDTSGNLRVLTQQGTNPWVITGSGTAGTPATGVVTVQGITGMTPISVTANKSTTSNFTTVAGATSSTAILASNANRIAASIYNNTNKNMYILCNSGAASTTNYSILLMQGSYWEVPSDYQGAINAIWAAGVSGNANVTEFTP